jgi:hypothetical protein
LYCKNRFKKKEEAERHINSLHLRRYSWSCAAISSFKDVFYPSSTRPHDAEVCGYCGEEVLCTGPVDEHGVKIAAQSDCDLRYEHLSKVHNFRQCNLAKKFFRVDHFRQHLKHSHRGVNGNWMKVLENACMEDEQARGDTMFISTGLYNTA